jgi:thiamine-phosphate pyrophosphorylase
MSRRQYLPNLWLLSDARNDARLETALAALPPASGFVYRHYHLPPDERQARFKALKAVADAVGHITILAAPDALALQWGAQGTYGPARAPAPGLLRLATAHDQAELALANAMRADGVFLSPVFPTRTHPGARTLGVREFHRLAASSRVPVIALGGMDEARARELRWPRWGAIDGLSHAAPPAAG